MKLNPPKPGAWIGNTPALTTLAAKSGNRLTNIRWVQGNPKMLCDLNGETVTTFEAARLLKQLWRLEVA